MPGLVDELLGLIRSGDRTEAVNLAKARCGIPDRAAYRYVQDIERIHQDELRGPTRMAESMAEQDAAIAKIAEPARQSRVSAAKQALQKQWDTAVIGEVRESRGCVMAPVEVGRFSFGPPLPETDLRNLPGLHIAAPKVWRLADHRWWGEAVWVRGRIGKAFGYTPMTVEELGEKTILSEVFAARSWVAPDCRPMAFHVHGNQSGEARLGYLRPDEPDESTAVHCAGALWALLVAEYADVQDYHDRAFHSVGGVWFDFGIDEGRVHSDGIVYADLREY